MMYFDIGANIGRWSLANIHLCDKIIAVEASPKTFNKLLDNCRNDKIISLNYAVCNNNCNDITFYEAAANTISTINKEWLTDETSRFYNYQYEEITCRTITIDKLIKKYGLPDFIKVDVEGGEYECISSLTQKVKLLCFEWASETNKITLDCIDYLNKLGYTKYYIQIEDNYSFRPQDNDFYDINTTKTKLSKMTPKKEWGMIWCQ